MPLWTKEENDLLLNNYDALGLAELQSLCGRSERAIRSHARTLGLSRPALKSPHGSLAKLLNDEPVAAYWNGFLAADGAVEST